MSSARPILRLAVAAVAVAAVGIARAEPLFRTTDDGGTFLYRARPGDHPSIVAEMFGVPKDAFGDFLAENGITDPTRVGAGFVYRVPNGAARAAGARLAELADERARAAAARDDAEGRARALAADAAAARAEAEAATARLGALERRVALWPFLQLGLLLAVGAAVAAGWVAAAAVRRERAAERRARTLALELDEKRRTALAERQESAKRILDLETRLRTLESQVVVRVGPRPRESAG